MGQYYEYKGDIYKYYNAPKDYYLKMTNWISGEDRRKYEFEIDKSKLVKISANVALSKTNSYWNSGIHTWTFNDVEYNNDGNLSMDINKVPRHKFTNKYIGRDNNLYSYDETYMLIWHQGHLYWMETYYYPRVTLYKFDNIATKPNVFAKWTDVKNCKPVKNVSTGMYV